jgi:hypothetical protein
MAGEIQLNSVSLATESSGTVTLNSSTDIKGCINASGSAPIYACRAWINFDGTSASIGTGRASGNVSGVTDNGTGDYTVTFGTEMPDKNYSVCSVGSRNYDNTSSNLNPIAWTAPYNNLSTSVSINVTQTNSGFSATANLIDYPNLNVAIFR